PKTALYVGVKTTLGNTADYESNDDKQNEDSEDHNTGHQNDASIHLAFTRRSCSILGITTYCLEVGVFQADNHFHPRAILADKLHIKRVIWCLSLRIGQRQGSRRCINIALDVLDDISIGINITQRKLLLV